MRQKKKWNERGAVVEQALLKHAIDQRDKGNQNLLNFGVIRLCTLRVLNAHSVLLCSSRGPSRIYPSTPTCSTSRGAFQSFKWFETFSRAPKSKSENLMIIKVWRRSWIRQGSNEILQISEIVWSAHLFGSLLCKHFKEEDGCAKIIDLSVLFCKVDECSEGYVYSFTAGKVQTSLGKQYRA